MNILPLVFLLKNAGCLRVFMKTSRLECTADTNRTYQSIEDCDISNKQMQRNLNTIIRWREPRFLMSVQPMTNGLPPSRWISRKAASNKAKKYISA